MCRGASRAPAVVSIPRSSIPRPTKKPKSQRPCAWAARYAKRVSSMLSGPGSGTGCGADVPKKSVDASCGSAAEPPDPRPVGLGAGHAVTFQWVEVLGPLTSGQDLTTDQAAAAMTDILSGNATSAQIAAVIVGPPRGELGVPTVFNFLGPLANPARVRRQVVGIGDKRMAEKMAGVLKARGSQRALVVFGHDGLDEITTTTTSTVVELAEDGELRRYELDPAAHGLKLAQPADLRGGDVEANVAATRNVLAGRPGPHRDIVVLNAAAGLLASGLADDIASGLSMAAAAIDDGRAQRALDQLVEASNR